MYEDVVSDGDYSGELRHTYLTGAWQYCPRCNEKVKIDDCTWQRGLLLCPICLDKMLLGTREPAIAAVLEDGKEELAPVQKLRNPDDNNLEDQAFNFDLST